MAIFPGEPGLVGFIGAKDNGSGDNNGSYKTCEAPVKSTPPTNQHLTFYWPDALPVTKLCRLSEGNNYRELLNKILHPS